MYSACTVTRHTAWGSGAPRAPQSSTSLPPSVGDEGLDERISASTVRALPRAGALAAAAGLLRVMGPRSAVLLPPPPAAGAFLAAAAS